MGKTLFRELKSAITLNLNKGYYYNSLKKKVRKFSIQNVVYCGWPTQDNQNILSDNDTDKLTNIYLKKPVEDIIEIGKLLMKHGNKNSKLILIGSTSSKAGRHNYKNPFYSLGKNILNSLNEILSLELGKKEMLSVVLEFDIIDGGMNNSLSEMNKDLARDRVPSGKIPTMKEAVKQIKWIMSNKSTLINGSSIKLSGGALP
jgi:NAD(P)-dependent dehydrogenase (short-subunit alcohol dehydrogenase family)